MAFAKSLDAVVRIYCVLERLRAVRDTLNIGKSNGGPRDGEGRKAEIGGVGEGRIAAIIHDIEAADTMVVVVVG